MRSIVGNRFSICFLACAFGILPATSSAHAQGQTAAKDRTVILISLDGFPAYDLEDTKLPIPTLRSLMETGSWAKSLEPINPTWTWPNHTTMVTGVDARSHGVLYNGVLRRSNDPPSVKIDPAVPRDQMVQGRTIYDAAREAGLTTAQVDWVAINDARNITWAFPEKASPSDPLVKEMIAKGVLKPEDISDQGHSSIVWRDEIWTRAGVYLLQEHKPNLLLFHLLSLDSTHHTYAPRSLASYDAIAFLDSCIRRLIDATKAAGIFDRTTFFVVSDHGFKSVRKQIWLRDVLDDAHFGPDVQVVPEGGSGMIYVGSEERNQVLDRLVRTFNGTEGVASVLRDSDFASYGYPLPSANRQMPDLVVLAKSGYGFTGKRKEPGPAVAEVDPPVGAHGYLNTDPEMQAIFIASGYGIKKGVALGAIPNTRIAPTLASLMNVQPPHAGDPLREILQ